MGPPIRLDAKAGNAGHDAAAFVGQRLHGVDERFEVTGAVRDETDDGEFVSTFRNEDPRIDAVAHRECEGPVGVHRAVGGRREIEGAVGRHPYRREGVDRVDPPELRDLLHRRRQLARHTQRPGSVSLRHRQEHHLRLVAAKGFGAPLVEGVGLRSPVQEQVSRGVDRHARRESEKRAERDAPHRQDQSPPALHRAGL